MSIRAQREQIRKLSVKDRKLARLLFSKSVCDEDIFFLNYLYEERQHMTYMFATGGSLVGAVCANFAFFRLNSYGYQFMFTAALGLMSHMYLRK
jgi:hypothetical protein